MTKGLKWHKDKGGRRVYTNRPQTICHPDRPHKAHGLCSACYMNQRDRARGIMPREARPRASCHPDRPHSAKGLCKVCYNRIYQRKVAARKEIFAEIPLKEGVKHNSDWFWWSKKDTDALNDCIRRRGLTLNMGGERLAA